MKATAASSHYGTVGQSAIFVFELLQRLHPAMAGIHIDHNQVADLACGDTNVCLGEFIPPSADG
jgi:hypothetical protein